MDKSGYTKPNGEETEREALIRPSSWRQSAQLFLEVVKLKCWVDSAFVCEVIYMHESQNQSRRNRHP
jgi:hypothetical protein